MYWDRKSRPEFGMCSVRFIQWFLTKNIKEKTGDLKFRLEWARFRFTQCPVSSGFTVRTMSEARFSTCFWSSYKWIVYTMYIYCDYPAMLQSLKELLYCLNKEQKQVSFSSFFKLSSVKSVLILLPFLTVTQSELGTRKTISCSVTLCNKKVSSQINFIEPVLDII